MPTLSQTFDCDSPVALVTGSGAPRVGQAVARHLAQLGCRIGLHANTSRQEAECAANDIHEQHGADTLVTTGSLLQEAECERIVAETADHFGRIDILVNTAAIWEPKSLEAVTADDLRRYQDVNSTGTFLCSRAAGLRMAAQPSGGSIVLFGDWATVRPYLDHAAYFPSKGSIEAMTRSLAVELAHRNADVRVNCIQPGPVLLDGCVSQDQRDRLAESTLVRRVGTPEAVAHAVQFLCENDFVTGICLPVDGGRQIFAPDGLQVGFNTG